MPHDQPAVIRRPEPLTAGGFAGFGTVIERPMGGGAAANDGTAWRHDDLAALTLDAAGGRPQLSWFHVAARALPLRIERLERHPLSSQLFMPVGGARFLVIVAAGDAAPDGAGLRAFLTDGRQGVCYAPGTWHHPVVALDAATDFLVLGRAGSNTPEDCEVQALAGGAVLITP